MLAGEPLPVAVDVQAGPSPAIRIQIVPETRTGEREKIAASRNPRIRNGHVETSLLAPLRARMRSA
jgi:hypothetical protein